MLGKCTTPPPYMALCYVTIGAGEGGKKRLFSFFYTHIFYLPESDYSSNKNVKSLRLINSPIFFPSTSYRGGKFTVVSALHFTICKNVAQIFWSTIGLAPITKFSYRILHSHIFMILAFSLFLREGCWGDGGNGGGVGVLRCCSGHNG